MIIDYYDLGFHFVGGNIYIGGGDDEVNENDYGGDWFLTTESCIYFCLLPFIIIALLGVTSTSGYQMVVNVGETKQIKDMAISSLQVKRFDNKLPGNPRSDTVKVCTFG